MHGKSNIKFSLVNFTFDAFKCVFPTANNQKAKVLACVFCDIRIGISMTD